MIREPKPGNTLSPSLSVQQTQFTYHVSCVCCICTDAPFSTLSPAPNAQSICLLRRAEDMDDDLNTPIVISHLFDSTKTINSLADGKATISEADLNELREVWKTYAIDILGLQLADSASAANSNTAAYSGAIDLLLNIRLDAKRNKDWTTSDRIRNALTDLGFKIKDTKDGFEWSL